MSLTLCIIVNGDANQPALGTATDGFVLGVQSGSGDDMLTFSLLSALHLVASLCRLKRPPAVVERSLYSQSVD